ncbi:hypothetical protein [Haloprofundus salilacus]|uniref:hypothetical protein n=1 Tax=Haloprofundus salilacus TaxID=2876190 RepID=UPI001CCAA70A|nr:hypothetical protein [Haloprofundus salilacus]
MVTLTVDEEQWEAELPSGERWISADIIEDGQQPTITVATRNLETQLEWGGEQNNSGIATFTIEEKAISKNFDYKLCPR